MEDKYPDRWRGIKRLVGNRAQIFLENAVAMYYMSTFYREYCNFVLSQAKEGNRLHQRLDEKLCSSEMVAGLLYMYIMMPPGVCTWKTRATPSIPTTTACTVGIRARAIAFIQIQQPLRVSTKSNKYGGGKAPSQAKMLPVWQRMVEVAERMETDPEFLLNGNNYL